MTDKIRVAIADDIRDTRENIKTLLSFDQDIEVVGEAENGEEAVFIAKEVQPDIILMDINMPQKDGIEATQEITIEVPATTVVMMSVQKEQEYLKKAMAAGARDYIIKPFTSDNLVKTIHTTYETELKRKSKLNVSNRKEEINAKIISIFSTKGGVGKTTLATNLAVTIARRTKKKVALLDLDLLFGDVAIHLNVSVKSTIADLAKEINLLDEDTIEQYLVSHFSGVKILPAPIKPEYAEYITAQHIEKIINLLRKNYHYIIIDTAQNFEETTLIALDASEQILFISTLDIPTIKNVKSGLEVMESLSYSDTKIKIVLNKSSEQFGVTYQDFEESLNRKIWAHIPEDNYTVIHSVNKGFPFVMTRSEKKVAKSIYDISSNIINGKMVEKNQKTLLRKIFSL